MEEIANYISEPLDQQALKRSIVVTGLPRGGTTLLGCLIGSLENSYCISEPMDIEEKLRLSTTPEIFLGYTRTYFENQRSCILLTGKSINRVAKDGRPITNYFSRIGKSIVTEYMITEEPVKILDENFTIAVKHNAHFLSILPHLCTEPDISVIGIIRHPIPTILSWRSLDLPISKGRLPSGEKFWPELFEIANSDQDVLVRQVKIYELIITRLLAFREYIRLVSYELLVSDPLQLCMIMNQKFNGTNKLQNRNRNKEYNWQDVNKIRTVLESNAQNTCKLYSMDDLDSPAVFSIPG